jgi:uncharacterized membrane protein
MDLDLLPLGWVHTVACLIALATGAAGFTTRKGSPGHILNGRVYLGSMVVLNVSALGIYRLDIFFFPHMLAVLTLVIIAVGWASARLHRPRRFWKHVHLSSMIASYYLLLGGGVNEAFLRVHALREILNDRGPILLGQAHAALALVFLILLLGWNAVEIARALRRRRTAPA